MKSKFARAPLALAVSMLLAQSALAAVQTLPQIDRSLQSAGAKRVHDTTPRLRVLMEALPSVYDAKALGIEGVARAHLEQRLLRSGAGKASAEAFELVNTNSMHGGARIVQFKRRINGIEVFREDVGLLIDAKSRLVAFRGSDRLLAQDSAKALQSFVLGESDAAALALAEYGIDRSLAAQTLRSGRRDGDYQWFDVAGNQRSAAGAVNRNPVRVKAVYFPLAEGGVVPAWYVETQVQAGERADTEYYAHIFSAVDGRRLFRNFQQADGASAYTYRVWAEAAPTGLPQPNPYGRNDTPHPTGLPTYTPSFVAPSLVAMVNAPFSQSATDFWLPAGATEATGNNTDAYLDLADPDGFNTGVDIRPNVTAANTFDRTYDVNAEPGSSADQRKAASIQQFYWVNWLHDDYYDAGFAEADGNAQNDNFGRGGIGNDRIRSEGQDNTGTCAPTCANNANMSTPADGASPRMQMYVWSPVAPHALTVNAVNYVHGTASFGAQSFNVTAGIVRTQPLDACVTVTNAAAVSGKIAFVDRGGCNFDVKTKMAQDAGAVGVILGNVAGSVNPATAPNMGPGTTPQTGITIGTMSVNFADGETIRGQLGDPSPDTATLFRGVGVGRDGTIDGMVIAHEWGHYISNRLVGNASGLSNQKGRGMGEGWGDFHSLLSAVKAEDGPGGPTADFSDNYVQGSYASGNTYYGIRRYPYSTRMVVNPLTFRHTVNGVALPASPAPAFGADGASNSQVHNTGEVWASMLWECYAGLLNDTLGGTPRLTFAQARERMKEYVVGGYKLTPSAPTMTEARDAVLATIAANDIDDFEICAAGFAKRGLGILAVDAPRDSTTNAGAVEDFTAGGDLAATALSGDDDAGCDNDGYLDLDETGSLSIDVRNVGWVSLTGGSVSISANHPGVAFPSGASASLGASTPYQTQNVSVPIRLDAIPLSRVVQFTATPTEGTIINPPGTARSVHVRVATYEAPLTSATEGFSANAYPWTTVQSDGATPAFAWYRSDMNASGSRVAIGPNSGGAGVTALVSGPISVGTGTFSIALTHRYQFEGGTTGDPTNWDGGQVEISTDNGVSWTSIGGAAYDGTINGNSGNPLQGEQAFVGTSTGYPSTMVDTINLGTTYANQSVRLRFAVGTDSAAGAPGWELHSLALTGAGTPFASLSPQDYSCSPTGNVMFANGFE
jgi:hypothetical protein